MQFDLTLLGTNSAVPTADRFTTAQVLNVQSNAYLIDCGEGAQIRMQQFKVRRGKINAVFISHLHGDHINGLVGFLNSLALNNRSTTLDIFAPEGLKKLVDISLALVGSTFPYSCVFHTIDTTQSKLIFEDKYIEVYTIPLVHRVPTAGFLFKEKSRGRKIIADQIEQYSIPHSDIKSIKDGADWKNPEGTLIPNHLLTTDATPTRSYAYCSDTAYTESILPIIKGADLLYHESTYCEDAKELAGERGHSTAKEAATIAKLAGVKQLILGHYSSRYKNLDPFLNEAQSVFPNTVLGQDGMKLEVALASKGK